MVKYDHEKAIEYFERSKYKKLEEIISHADIEKMSVKESVQLISFKALIQQKLYKIYWSDEVVKLSMMVLNRVNKSRQLYVEAKLLVNEAQIIIRNKKDDSRFKRALILFLFADECFSQQGCKLDKLFVKDEKLRTTFEMLKNNSGRAEEINRIVEEYIVLNGQFDKFRGEKAETRRLNSKFHSLRIMAYCGYPYAKILGREVAEKFFSRGNKLKALAAIIYTLGRVGFYINEFSAWVRGE